MKIIKLLFAFLFFVSFTQQNKAISKIELKTKSYETICMVKLQTAPDETAIYVEKI